MLQLQQFPKIPKKIRTLLSLGLAWFYALIWSGSFQKGFLMLNWFTTCLHLPLTLKKFPFLSSLIVIFEYLGSHSESEVCLIDIPTVVEVFSFSFPAVADDFWFYVGRCGYFLVCRCGRIFAFGLRRCEWVWGLNFNVLSDVCVLPQWNIGFKSVALSFLSSVVAEGKLLLLPSSL